MPYLPKFDNQEYPRESQVFELQNCNQDISISCSSEECNILNITDAKGTVKKLIAGTVTANIVRNQASCGPQDYRRDSYLREDYVAIRGVDADNTEVNLLLFSIGIYPKSDQTLEDLFAEIKAAICACSNP